jgi:hypothetical protein
MTRSAGVQRMNEDTLIANFAHGTEEQRYVSVIAAGKRFVLFRISGHMTWGDVMNPRVYTPVQFVLIPKRTWWLAYPPKKREWTGRVPRATLINAFTEAERTGKLEGT